MALDTLDTVLGFAAVMLVLSMFVTACVQLVSAFFRLRSGSLVWGLQQMFEQLQLDRTLAAQLARQVVDNVPVLKSGSRWLFGESAVAIKPAELTKILRGIADGHLGDQATLAGPVKTWLVQLGAQPDDADRLSQRLPQIEEELQKLFPQQAQAAREAVARVLDNGDRLALRVEDWFDSAMGRAADRFTLMARYFTVAISCMLVVGLGVDARHIYQRLHDDRDLRAKWVAQVEPMVQDAEKRLGKEQCKDLAAQALQAVALAKDTDPGLAKAITQALVRVRPDQRDAGRVLLTELATSAQAIDKTAAASAARTAFDSAYDQSAKDCFGEALATVKKQADEMQRTRDLLHNQDTGPSLFGMLLAAVLLSLGAPFWFNTLKNLSSLRPLVAGKSGPSSAGSGAAAPRT